MRIALVCPYSCTVPGGVQTQVLGLARAFRSLGDEVVVIAPADKARMIGHLDAAELGGARFIAVGTAMPVSVNGSRAPVSPWPTTMARTLGALREFAPDVVHVHEPLVPGPGLATVMFGPRPLVGTFHRSGDDLAYRSYGRLVGRWTRRLDAVFAVSEQASSTARACVRGLAQDLAIINNGVELDRQAAFEHWPTKAATVMFIGRHEQRKGLAILLEAFSSLPPSTRLWVLGEGPDTSRLRNRFASEPRIEWLGAVDDDEKGRRMAGADVFVAPSLGGESFGLVLLEAMAAGTAVVASDLPGYIQAAGGAALFVPPGDPQALSKALNRLLGDKKERDELSEKGRRRARECDMAKVAQRYRGVYAGLVSAGRE